MASTHEQGAAARPRFNAYLTSEQIAWINRMRGKYMQSTGRNLTSTAFLRALVAQVQALPWDELEAILDSNMPARGRSQ